MANALISSHGHQTILFESPQALNCEFCVLPNPAVYHCIECDVNLCGNCFKIPREISHSHHHRDHILRLTVTPKLPDLNESFPDYTDLYFLVCKGCHYISLPRGHYRCRDCEFCMCVECGISTKRKTPIGWECTEEFPHWSDVHQIARCRFREYALVVEKFRYDCKICELSMSGTGYACLELRCNTFIHESCIDTPQVMHHPLHPHHLLTHPDFTLDSDYKRCRACWQSFTVRNQTTYNCNRCTFALHFQCALSAVRPIKLGSHEHSLVSVLIGDSLSKCYICENQVQNHGLSCIECEEFFHLECVSVPRELKHNLHEHNLTLVRGLQYASHKYQQIEYPCDICEGMIKEATSIHVYGCRLCKFYVHIECVLSKEDGFVEFFSSMWSKKHDENTKNSNISSDKEINKFIHDHPLSLQNGANKLCQMCMLQIKVQAYACEDCRDDDYWVHEKCAALPHTLVDHPLHPSHKLHLTRGSSFVVACNACGYASDRFHFSCRPCDFVLDVNCALLSKVGETFYNKHGEKSLKHPLHREHELTLANFRTYLQRKCDMCGELLFGSSYFCKRCYLFRGFHKTCLEWPSLVEGHPIAPQHVLQLGETDLWDLPEYPKCFACGDLIKSWFGYEVINSKRCTFYHIECGSSLARPLSREGHGHQFYYVHHKPAKGGSSYKFLRCASCREEAKISYYRCLKCGLYFHLRCLRDAKWLPRIAKHKQHLHWLSLKDYVDYEGYYCDICEEPRDPEHPSYGCDDCEFIAHMECIVSVENVSRVILEEIETDGVKIRECSSYS